MSSFDSEFAEDAFPLLLSEFGVGTTYRPNGGGTRAIDAIITTSAVEEHDVPNAPAVRALVRVLNDASVGISSSEVVVGRDRIDVVLPLDSAAVPLTIQRVLDDSPGVLSLEAY